MTDKPLDSSASIDTDEVRKRHERYRHSAISRDCKRCDEPFPCDAIRLADEVDRLREALEETGCMYHDQRLSDKSQCFCGDCDSDDDGCDCPRCAALEEK